MNRKNMVCLMSSRHQWKLFLGGYKESVKMTEVEQDFW